MTTPTTFEIGANLAGCATLASQDCVDPEASFSDVADKIKLESGLIRGLGLPKAEWHFGYLYKAQLDVLKSYVTGISGAVCIATLNNEMDFLRYNCNMEMPETYQIRSPDGKQVYMDVTIKFSELVEAE